MNAKLRGLAQALVTEVDRLMETKDGEASEAEWWRQLDWGSPDYRTLFDSLGEETQKMVIDAGLCPTCGDDLETKEEEEPASEDIVEDKPDIEEEQDVEEVLPPVETPPPPFDVETSQRVTERTRAKIKELEL